MTLSSTLTKTSLYSRTLNTLPTEFQISHEVHQDFCVQYGDSGGHISILSVSSDCLSIIFIQEFLHAPLVWHTSRRKLLCQMAKNKLIINLQKWWNSQYLHGYTHAHSDTYTNIGTCSDACSVHCLIKAPPPLNDHL